MTNITRKNFMLLGFAPFIPVLWKKLRFNKKLQLPPLQDSPPENPIKFYRLNAVCTSYGREFTVHIADFVDFDKLSNYADGHPGRERNMMYFFETCDIAVDFPHFDYPYNV